MGDSVQSQQDPVARLPSRCDAYVVIARRYRPQSFDELVGQEHVAEALRNAIAGGRVGHAYLFTGARGVGKTSAARILAKALNCREGPTPTPCNQCDLCRRISLGEDVDVLEIDGASNRGIDEIRQLRENAGIRPSRARFKLYIIDEVHMLTREAFNALLKTLEEPPPHVKFIFCTTEPTRIPVTIVSRCQRFDFAGISTEAIVRRLGQIVKAEGVEAEPEALRLLACRAGGSMRDSQSLLEQLLAFSGARITVADLHRLLGTADEQRLCRLGCLLAERQAAAALAELDAAVDQGADPALVVEQLFGFFRDLMVAAAGCKGEAFLYASPERYNELAPLAQRWGLTNLLAVMQILEQTLARMRYSTQARVLAELALVRICQLEDLEELGRLIARLRPDGAAERASIGEQRAAERRPIAEQGAAERRPIPEQGPAERTPGIKEGAIAGVEQRAGKGQAGFEATQPKEDAGPTGFGGDSWESSIVTNGGFPGQPDYEESESDSAAAAAHGAVAAGHPRSVGGSESDPAAAGTHGASPATASPAEAPRHSAALGEESPALSSRDPQQAVETWHAALERLSGLVVEHARKFRHARWSGPSRLVIGFEPRYAVAKSYCERADQTRRLEASLSEVAGRPVKVEFVIEEVSVAEQGPKRPVVSPRQQLLQVGKHPLIQRAGELFGAQPVRVEEPPEGE